MTALKCVVCSSKVVRDAGFFVCTRSGCGWTKLIPKQEREKMIGDDNITYPIEGPGELGPEIKPHEPVNSPPHYNQGGIECIDALKAALTPEEYIGFLKGNTIKYLWRMNHKTSPSEDSAKAQWYLNKLNEELKNE